MVKTGKNLDVLIPFLKESAGSKRERGLLFEKISRSLSF
jgi:hypothetical protein